VERIKKLVFAPTGLFTGQVSSTKMGYTKKMVLKKIWVKKNVYMGFCVLGFLLRGLK
jgi:hypothetical protein